MRAEVEAKFTADDPSVLTRLAAVPSLGFADLGPARTVAETDRYLDTRDGALARARWACRLREREGTTRVSLKGPAEPTTGDWHHRRPELEGPATTSTDPEEWPDSDARRRLVALAGGSDLIERFTLRQQRTERAVSVDGREVATLSLDVAAIVEGGHDRGQLVVVELELADAGALPAERFATLAEALVATPGLRAEPRTKLEHALARLDGS